MTNFEIKIKVENLEDILALIRKAGGVYKNDMHQIDYYLNTGLFKEKIREINKAEIQKISYRRAEVLGRKESKYNIERIDEAKKKELLDNNEVRCVVDKNRSLWIYKHTRIHLDKVVGLGCFLELETVIKDISASQGLIEFKKIIELLKIDPEKAVPYSYSDLILEKQEDHSTVFVNNFANI